MTLINKQISKEQSRDAGMALVLLLLLVYSRYQHRGWLIAAIVAQIVNMVVPQIFRPLAVVWFGLSNLLGAIMPKVVLGIVYFVVVTPVAFVRRLMGQDRLSLRAFKGSNESVMVVRNHLFTAQDLKKPY